MFQQLLDNYHFNAARIWLSVPYFAAAAFAGYFLVIRRASLFGLVLSNLAKVSFITGFGIHALMHSTDSYELINNQNHSMVTSQLFHLDAIILPVASSIMVLMILFSRSFSTRARNIETFFAIALVVLTAAVPFLHKIFKANDTIIARAYFTEILFTHESVFLHYLPFIGILVVVLLVFYRLFLFIAFDETQARISGMNVVLYYFIFYLAAGFIIAFCVRVIGIYVTMSALLIPAFISISIFRSIWLSMVMTVVLSILFSLCGFFVSFAFGDLPTDPTIIITFATLAAFTFLLQRLMGHRRSS